MIVLVDTSVWIRFLSNRAPYAGELDGLLSRDEVSGHDFVFGELLVGDKAGRKQVLAGTTDPRLATVATELGIGTAERMS